MKKNFNLLPAICFLLLLGSCQKEVYQLPEKPETPKLQLTQTQKDLKDRLEQRALITATVMRDAQMVKLYAQAVKDKLKANKQNDETITFEEILKEKPAYLKNFAENFKEKYSEIFYNHNYFRAYKFPTPTKPSGNNLTGTIGDDLFTDADGTQIYFPYSENFTIADLDTVAITYDPLQDIENVDAYKEMNIPDSMEIFIANEEYAKEKPTFVLNVDVDYTPGGTQSPDSVPPPPGFACNFLTTNTFADMYNDNYVVSAHIPYLRLLKNFRTWVGGSNILTVQQWYVNPTLVPSNPSPTLPNMNENFRYVFNNLKVLRSEVGKWKQVNQIWNDDWRLVQYNNPMVAFAKKGWFYNANGDFTGQISAGLKLDTIRNASGTITGYRWIPSFNSNVSVSFNAHMGSQWDLLGTDYISRRGLLANCVGNNFSAGTATAAPRLAMLFNPLRIETVYDVFLDPTAYSIRQLGDSYQYYFKVRECH